MIQRQQWMRILVNNDLNYSTFLTEFSCSFYNVWMLQCCFIVTAWKNYSAQHSEFLLLIFPGERNHWLIGKHASKNISIQTIRCSFQLKWTSVAVKHQQLLVLFTQTMITGADYWSIKTYFHVDSLCNTMLWTLLPLCMICKRIHSNICFTCTAFLT